MSRKKAKICHIVRHFIKVPQTMAWVTVNIAVWINSAGLGLDPHHVTQRNKNGGSRLLTVTREQSPEMPISAARL
jgi:hypothetical protein